jgi:hypothetical protein
VSLDLLGRFPKTKNGNTYVICCTDYLTKWAIAKALPSGSASDVARFLIDDVICIHSCPAEILSDRGAQFRSSLMLDLAKGLGVKSNFCSGFRPQVNGLVERYNATLVSMLSQFVNDKHDDWDRYVSLSTFAYNTARQESTGFSPFYLVYGRQAVLPMDVSLRQGLDLSVDAATVIRRVDEARKLAAERIKGAQKKQKDRYDKSHQTVEYRVGEMVRIFTPLRKVGRVAKFLHRWSMPCRVLKRLSDVNYEVAIRKGRGGKLTKDVVHVARMKRSYPSGDWRVRLSGESN